MAMGPGKYDDEVTELMERLKAHGIILLVFGGPKGAGFSMQATLEVTLALPKILRSMADQIEESGPL